MLVTVGALALVACGGGDDDEAGDVDATAAVEATTPETTERQTTTLAPTTSTTTTIPGLTRDAELAVRACTSAMSGLIGARLLDGDLETGQEAQDLCDTAATQVETDDAGPPELLTAIRRANVVMAVAAVESFDVAAFTAERAGEIDAELRELAFGIEALLD